MTDPSRSDMTDSKVAATKCSRYNVFVATGLTQTWLSSMDTSGLGTGALGKAIPLQGARKVRIRVTMNAAAASDQVELIPVFSDQDAEPTAIGSDTWETPCVLTDGTYAETTPGGTLPSGFDALQDYNMGVYRPLMVRFDAATGATAEQRFSVTLNCDEHKWFALLFHNVANQTITAVTIDVSLAA